jgi:2-dehydro-3-deoxygluconokinase
MVRRAGDGVVRNTPPEVVTLGECLVSLVASSTGPLSETATFERHIAGAEANVAVGLARLGRSVAYIGRVGRDGFGTAVVRKLRGEGVNVDHLALADGSTGVMIRERRAFGSAQVLYFRRDSAASGLGPGDVDAAAELLNAARWLHVTGITPALSATARAAVMRAIEVARESNATISLDLNLRRKLWSEAEAAVVLRELASRADVVMGDEDEVKLVLGGTAERNSGDDLAKRLRELGPKTAIVKLGANGAVAAEEGRRTVRVAGLSVPSIVDPVGAGDGFAAGYIAATLEGQSVEVALRSANACAASVLGVIGDMAGLPDRAELDRLLAATPGGDTIR